MFFKKDFTKDKIKISFMVSHFDSSTVGLTIVGNIRLYNNSDSILILKGKSLEENVWFIISDEIDGGSDVKNGGRLKSLVNIDFNKRHQPEIKILPGGFLESKFLTGFDINFQETNPMHLACFIKIGNELYYSQTEKVQLK